MARKTPEQKKIRDRLLAKSLIAHDGNLAASWQAIHGPSKNDKIASNNCGNYLRKNRAEMAEHFKQLLFNHINTKPDGVVKELANQITANKEIAIGGGETKSVCDNSARIEAIKVWLKLYGLTGEDIGTQNNLQINIGAVDTDKLDKILNKLKECRTSTEDCILQSEVIDIVPIK